MQPPPLPELKQGLETEDSSLDSRYHALDLTISQNRHRQDALIDELEEILKRVEAK